MPYIRTLVGQIWESLSYSCKEKLRDINLQGYKDIEYKYNQKLKAWNQLKSDRHREKARKNQNKHLCQISSARKSSGLMSLVALGESDKLLCQKNEITFFRISYNSALLRNTRKKRFPPHPRLQTVKYNNK